MALDRYSTRRAYVLGIGALAALAGCSGDDDSVATTGESPETTGEETTTGAGQEQTANESTPRQEREPFDPEDPLAERYEVDEREAVYRETPDGELRVKAALPDGGGPFPTIVHVHGGAWRYGSAGFGGMERVARAGVAATSIEYRLSGTASYPAPVRDVVAAVQWVRSNEPGWPLDTDRVALLGDSAGAHLAALVAAAPAHRNFQPEGFDAGASAAIDAFVGHYGIYDLRRRDACADRNTSQFFGEDCDDATVVAEASPVTHVDGNHPPSRLFHGADDELVPPRSSRNYRDILQSAGVPVEYDELEGANHGYVDPNNDQADVRRESHERTLTFLFEGPWSDG